MISIPEFEFDPEKSRTNKAKHGIDFEEAGSLWEDPHLAEVPARSTDEPRFAAIGRIGARFWTAICTHREPCIRIISVRRSRNEEIDIYNDIGG